MFALGIGRAVCALVTAVARLAHACFMGPNCLTPDAFIASPTSPDTWASAAPPGPASHLASTVASARGTCRAAAADSGVFEDDDRCAGVKSFIPGSAVPRERLEPPLIGPAAEPPPLMAIKMPPK